MTLQLVKPVRPFVDPPRDVRWQPWFLHEIEPLRSPSLEHNSTYRRHWTRQSPLRFALTYLDHHLVLQGSDPPTVTFNEMHLGLSQAAKHWMAPVRWREAWIGPRGVGKSSWIYLILPLWALAHGHRQYFMAFSHTAKMAERQLATLRMELETNDLLCSDYPELAPRRIRGAANTNRTVVANGGTIAAAGLGENTLGSKSGAARPDLIALDDIEPLEDTMTEDAKRKIITAITGAVIPMAAPHAAIGIFGTTTSYDSAVHRIAQHARGRMHVDWVADNAIHARIFPGIMVDPETGQERSLWPERWPLSETHLGETLRRSVDGKTPRSFELNYLLDPSPFGEESGSLWREELFLRPAGHIYNSMVEHAMYIDTAPTSHRNSDRNAIVIVGRDPARRWAVVEYAWAGRVSAEQLRHLIRRHAEREPTLRMVFVEANQGSDLWHGMLNPRHDPLPRQLTLKLDHVRGSKVDRAKAALQYYERGQVFHARGFTDLERELVLFPSPKINDDMVDALSGALRWAFDPTW